MRDNVFWLGVWGIIGIALISTIFLTSNYWKDHNAKIVNMVNNGVSPVAAMCALQDDYGTHPVCLVIAAQQGGDK